MFDHGKKNNYKTSQYWLVFVKDSRNNSEGYVSCPCFHVCLHWSSVHPESREGKCESCWSIQKVEI